MRLDGIHQRAIDVVVPRLDRVGIADVALALRAQVVVVGGDVLAQTGIFGGIAQMQVGFGPQLVEARVLTELAVGLRLVHADDVHVGRQAERDVDLGHVGVDVGLVAFAGHGDAVVAVLDEVDVADLIEIDRRQQDVAVVGLADVDPALGRLALGRQEGAVEVAVAADAADDLV